MANTPEITADFSSKYSLPTKHSFKEEAKADPPRKWAISYNTNPSYFQEVTSEQERNIDRHGRYHYFLKSSIKEYRPYSFCICQQIVAELIGTHILIFAGCGAALVNKIQSLTIVGIALVWGLVLMAMIYAVGHVSGAHFNPAVTIAFATSRRLSWKQVPMYVLAQLLGATLASLTLRVLFDNQENIQATMTQFSDTTTDLEAITWEFIVTFILMFTICGVATDHRANKDFAGVAIGVTVLFNVMISGPITGASMNPARSLGPAVASGVYKNLWVYMVAPIIGALAATLVYSVLRVPKPEKPVETKSIYNQLYLHADP